MSRVIICIVVLCLLEMAAGAGPICLPDTVAAYAALGEGGCTVEGVLFKNWEEGASTTPDLSAGGATRIPAFLLPPVGPNVMLSDAVHIGAESSSDRVDVMENYLAGVPEPALLPLGGGLAALGLAQRRRR